MGRMHIFHSTKTRSGWVVREGGETLSSHVDQRKCERAAIEAARRDAEYGGQARAILHQPDGTVRREWNFGADPKPDVAN
jgi:uncharacterized protein DUF2188